jgi:hypothetical protein
LVGATLAAREKPSKCASAAEPLFDHDAKSWSADDLKDKKEDNDAT